MAQKLAAKLADLFKTRPYCDHYKLEVSVERTTMTVTATKGKLKHSAQVASYLAGQGKGAVSRKLERIVV